MPDKSISLLDTACARVGISRASTPAPVEDAKRRIDLIDVEVGILERELASGANHVERLGELKSEREELSQRFDALQSRWKDELELATDLDRIRTDLDSRLVEKDVEGAGKLRSLLSERSTALKSMQGEEPLVFNVVDREAVADVLAGWTGIPVGRMASDEIRSVLDLETRMGERIRGQSHALQAISEAMRISRAKLKDPRKPIGVFLMCGTSGVGKTETALTLAEMMYGGEQNVTVINMSEFKEEHKVSMLVGSPPGYVGYGEGGVLTEAVRRRPYSIVLLDEMEKAHPGVQDVFFQVFDKGMLKDGQGRDIDFKNTIIIMTSNAGTETIEKLASDPETMPDADGLTEALRPELLTVFKPAFLGRVTLVPYFPLSDEIVKDIVGINFRKLRDRVAQNYKSSFNWSPEVVDAVAARCTESQSGARNIENVIRRGIQPVLAARFLEAMANGDATESVSIDIDSNGEFTYTLN